MLKILTEDPLGYSVFFRNFSEFSHFRHLGGEGGGSSDPILGKWELVVRSFSRNLPLVDSNFAWRFLTCRNFRQKQVWLRRFSRPFIVMSLWILFIFRKSRILDENVMSPTLLGITSVFIENEPTFVFLTRPFYLLHRFFF